MAKYISFIPLTRTVHTIRVNHGKVYSGKAAYPATSAEIIP